MVTAKTTVSIGRSVVGELDSGITIACDEVTLNYDKREVVVKGLKSIKGYNGYFKFTGIGYVVENIEVVNSELRIKIPSDTNYEVKIGNQEHLLPKII